MSGLTLAALRRATAADHDQVDASIDVDRLVEVEYYAAVMRALIESAEIVEAVLPLVAHQLESTGVSLDQVSKRAAIDAEATFLAELAEPRPVRRCRSGDVKQFAAGLPGEGSMLGLLYVYVGSALGGQHLLRVARTAPWWRNDREHLLLRPYGEHLGDRWRAVANALVRLDPDETNAAVMAARAGFDVFRRSLIDHLVAEGVR